MSKTCYRAGFYATIPNSIYRHFNRKEPGIYVTDTIEHVFKWWEVLKQDGMIDETYLTLKMFKLETRVDIQFHDVGVPSVKERLKEAVLMPNLVVRFEELELWKLVMDGDEVIWNGRPPVYYDVALPMEPVSIRDSYNYPTKLVTQRRARYELTRAVDEERRLIYTFKEYIR